MLFLLSKFRKDCQTFEILIACCSLPSCPIFWKPLTLSQYILKHSYQCSHPNSNTLSNLKNPNSIAINTQTLTSMLLLQPKHTLKTPQLTIHLVVFQFPLPNNVENRRDQPLSHECKVRSMKGVLKRVLAIVQLIPDYKPSCPEPHPHLIWVLKAFNFYNSENFCVIFKYFKSFDIKIKAGQRDWPLLYKCKSKSVKGVLKNLWWYLHSIAGISEFCITLDSLEDVFSLAFSKPVGKRLVLGEKKVIVTPQVSLYSDNSSYSSCYS